MPSGEDWRSALSVGDEVFWTDPDNGICSGYRTITEIVSDSGTIESDETVVRLTDNGNVTEAYAGELSPLKPAEAVKLPEGGAPIGASVPQLFVDEESATQFSTLLGDFFKGLAHDGCTGKAYGVQRKDGLLCMTGFAGCGIEDLAYEFARSANLSLYGVTTSLRRIMRPVPGQRTPFGHSNR